MVLGEGANALLAQVDEKCEKCDNTQLAVKTMQLRSADEGGAFFRPGSCLREEGADALGGRSYGLLLVRQMWARVPTQQLGGPSGSEVVAVDGDLLASPVFILLNVARGGESVVERTTLTGGQASELDHGALLDGTAPATTLPRLLSARFDSCSAPSASVSLCSSSSSVPACSSLFPAPRSSRDPSCEDGTGLRNSPPRGFQRDDSAPLIWQSASPAYQAQDRSKIREHEGTTPRVCYIGTVRVLPSIKAFLSIPLPPLSLPSTPPSRKMSVPQDKRVLSIQSHVVCGFVGQSFRSSAAQNRQLTRPSFQATRQLRSLSNSSAGRLTPPTRLVLLSSLPPPSPTDPLLARSSSRTTPCASSPPWPWWASRC